jgi:hypothetical protein
MSSYLLSRSPEIRVVCPASVSTWTVLTRTSSLLEGFTWGAETEPRWRELSGVGSWPPAPRRLREPLLGPGASPVHKPLHHGPPDLEDAIGGWHL